MLNWIIAEGHKIVAVIILITQWLVHWEDIVDRFVGWFKVGTIIERRHTVFDPLKYLKLIPLFEKIVSDIEKAAQTPENLAVKADVQELINDLKEASK